MGSKGITVQIDPNALVPAVTFIRMSNRQMESQVLEARNLATEMLEGGVMEGERMQGQKANIETIVSSCTELQKLMADLTTATGQVYDKYINAETKQGIDAQVASHMEAVSKSGSSDALRKK